MNLKKTVTALGFAVALVLPLASLAQDVEKKPAAEKDDDDSKVQVKLGSGGFKVESSDGAYELQLGGRLQMDVAVHDEDTSQLRNGAEIRRARLYLKGNVGEAWSFKTQFDFAGNETSIKDLYLRRSWDNGIDLTVGNFKEPFSLEEQTSSKNITFIERALPVAAFSPSRALGVAVQKGWNRGSLAVGLFGEEVAFDAADSEDDGVGIAARATWAALESKSRVLHLGFSSEYREPREGLELRFDARPESAVSGEKLVRTRSLDGIESTTLYGLEVATTSGPFSVQGEYIQTTLARRQEADADLSGWYIYGSWFLTGESRPYEASDGSFGRIKPEGKRGAWEVGIRFSSIDLDDRDIEGGSEDNVTLGINWYANSNVRFLANYTMVESQRRGSVDDPGIFHFRAQVAF